MHATTILKSFNDTKYNLCKDDSKYYKHTKLNVLSKKLEMAMANEEDANEVAQVSNEVVANEVVAPKKQYGVISIVLDGVIIGELNVSEADKVSEANVSEADQVSEEESSEVHFSRNEIKIMKIFYELYKDIIEQADETTQMIYEYISKKYYDNEYKMNCLCEIGECCSKCCLHQGNVCVWNSRKYIANDEDDTLMNWTFGSGNWGRS
jgi:hypothetical protein